MTVQLYLLAVNDTSGRGGFFLPLGQSIFGTECANVPESLPIFGEMVERAAQLLVEHGSAEDPELAAVRILRQEFPDVPDPTFNVGRAVTRAKQGLEREQQDELSAEIDTLPAPAVEPDALDEAGQRIETLERAPLRQFGQACLPIHVLQDRITIPADLGRFAFLFSADKVGRHTLNTKDRDGKPLRIDVGNSDGANGLKSLTVEHQCLLFALFFEAQVSGLHYRCVGSKGFLEIRTSIPRLHRLMNPDCAYGGSSQKRITKQLDQLRDTPVVFQGTDGSRSDYRFVYAWHRDSTARVDTNVTVWLHWRWTEPFDPPVTAGKPNTRLKPFLLREYRAITSDYSRLLYVHFDWALGGHERAEIAHQTVLERAGAFHEENSTATALRRYASHQRWRLRYLWQLRGLELSSGGWLELDEARAAARDNRLRHGYKLVARRSKSKITDQPQISAEVDAGHGEYVAPVLSLACYRDAQQRWRQKPRSSRHPRLHDP